MNMIDKENLFNLFPEPENTDNVSESDVEINITESAHYNIGKFKKLIENHIIFFKHFKRGMQEAKAEYDEAETQRQAAFIVYNRAWFYINKVSLENREHVLDITLYNPYDLSYCLQLAIKFFETTEEYERCAHLFAIQNFLEEFAK